MCLESTFNAIPLIGVSRHRLLTDGNGITTLVAFHGCPLKCAYCINPQCQNDNGIKRWITPQSLFHELQEDDFYFRATGGGVCFGGGEPLLRHSFIREFKELCGDKWKIIVETSLNVPQKCVRVLSDIVDEYIVDIKDMSNTIYTQYTGVNNINVIQNLQYLIEAGLSANISIRVPLIPKFNNEEAIEKSVYELSQMGLNNIERFTYYTDLKPTGNYSADSSRMPIGKAICEILKSVRKTIADANNIEYHPVKCNHIGNCLGTCPTCEHELRLISETLWQREAEGEKITI